MTGLPKLVLKYVSYLTMTILSEEVKGTECFVEYGYLLDERGFICRKIFLLCYKNSMTAPN
jgi:hypothetical protein